MIKAVLSLIGLLVIVAVILLWLISLINWDGIIPENPYWSPDYEDEEDEEKPEG